MDAAQLERVGALLPIISDALSKAIGKDVLGCDVMMAFVVHAAAIANSLGISEDEFFDMVVKMYEATDVVWVEKH